MNLLSNLYRGNIQTDHPIEYPGTRVVADIKYTYRITKKGPILNGHVSKAILLDDKQPGYEDFIKGFRVFTDKQIKEVKVKWLKLFGYQFYKRPHEIVEVFNV